jgi:hypothetical protein
MGNSLILFTAHETATARSCSVILVVDATVAWLEPTDNRAHNRVVSTERTAKSLRNTSTQWQGRNDAGTQPSDRSSRPFVLSVGGMIETDARDALKIWKSIMTGGVYYLFVRRLSPGLLRARARCFEP